MIDRELIERIELNSTNLSDKEFNNSIKFVVEKYIGDDIPEQINCNNLHETIIEAYKLFLSNELHSIGIYDRKGNYNGTDALNYFTDDKNIYENRNKIEELKQEIELYKEFLKKNNALKSFEDYKLHNK